MAITESTLSAFLGKHIREICTIGYAADTDNHCAHFVSHVLGYRFQTTCRTMMNGEGTPGCIRVQQIFPRCPRVGTWASLPDSITWGLVFITNAGNVNVRRKTLENVPRKHIGIFYGSERTIYHYSNRGRQVISQSPAEFSTHYPAPDNAMFWGEAP